MTALLVIRASKSIAYRSVLLFDYICSDPAPGRHVCFGPKHSRSFSYLAVILICYLFPAAICLPDRRFGHGIVRFLHFSGFWKPKKSSCVCRWAPWHCRFLRQPYASPQCLWEWPSPPSVSLCRPRLLSISRSVGFPPACTGGRSLLPSR
jgi:hypothetical protein